MAIKLSNITTITIIITDNTTTGRANKSRDNFEIEAL